LNDLIVHRVIWKRLTNREIRQASTGNSNLQTRPKSGDLFFGETKAPIDKPRPWLLVEFSHSEQSYLIAFSRNSKDFCEYNLEDQEDLREPFVWLNHKHDWHPCSVLDSCGKVNFHLGKKGDWPTFMRVASVRSFLAANQRPVCSEDDTKLISRLLLSSNLIRRFNMHSQPLMPQAFIATLRRG
jgi:hypothetical protein